jgi:hypothetical protein
MKKYSLLFSLLLLSFFSNAQTHYGVFPNGKGLSTAQKIATAKSFGVHYIRHAYYLTSPAGPQLSDLKQIEASGLKIILNINYSHNVPSPYPTDMASYKKMVTDLLTQFKPAVAIIENEELNSLYHSGPIEDYINELKTGIDVCHQFGVPVADGGLTKPGLFIAAGLSLDQAQPSKGKGKAPMNAHLQGKASDFNTLIAFIKQSQADFVNFHYYTPVSSASELPRIVSYLRSETGKPAMTNEIGAYNQSTEAVTSILSNANLPYLVWYSADMGPGKAVSLTNENGTMRPNGDTFKSFAAAHGSDN